MFSEYASRFLAQSQSRFSLNQDQSTTPRNPLERQRGSQQRGSSRGYLQRQPFGNPYQSTTQTSRFPFASRLSSNNNPAPLFYSATDEFQDEDDGEEHEREVADFYALQQSRRDIDTGRLKDSSELEDDDEADAAQATKHAKKKSVDNGRGRGIKSSWTGDEETSKETADTAKRKQADSQASFVSAKGKDRLVDVELGSTIHEEEDEDYSDVEENPPSVQQFRRPGGFQSKVYESDYQPRESDAMMQGYRQDESVLRESVPTTLPQLNSNPPRHDVFWGTMFAISLAAMLATFILVWLHTSPPTNGVPLGDTIYTALHSSFYLLAVDTTVAIIVALVWLALLRSFARTLMIALLIAVPIILFAFSLYPFISSFYGPWRGSSIQDAVMRWLALVPAIMAATWTYTAYTGRQQFQKTVDLVEFSTKILAANPPLIATGFATLAAIVGWTWISLLMFTRVFLGGHVARGAATGFIISIGTWWIGIFFILTYLWGLGVISGIQRATTAATVSQWYFHRSVAPTIPPQRIAMASFNHAVTTQFGTICLAALLDLAVRLPLLVLPTMMSRYIVYFFWSLIPASITILTNPLVVTYAAIHSQPLTTAAQGLSRLSFISENSPTTTLTPRTFSQSRNSNNGTSSVHSYRYAKLFLFATRLISSAAFGFGGWVTAARMLQIDGASTRGSLYAYVIGLVAGAIGWAVLGAMENVLSGVLDAVVVCWGSEIGSYGAGQARHCREADQLLTDVE